MKAENIANGSMAVSYLSDHFWWCIKFGIKVGKCFMKTQVLSQARSVFRQLYFALAEQLTQCPSRGVGPLSVLGSFCRCNDFMLISIIITSPASSANQQTLDTKTVCSVYFCTNTHTCIWQNVRMTVFGVDDSLLEVMTNIDGDSLHEMAPWVWAEIFTGFCVASVEAHFLVQQRWWWE